MRTNIRLTKRFYLLLSLQLIALTFTIDFSHHLTQELQGNKRLVDTLFTPLNISFPFIFAFVVSIVNYIISLREKRIMPFLYAINLIFLAYAFLTIFGVFLFLSKQTILFIVSLPVLLTSLSILKDWLNLERSYKLTIFSILILILSSLWQKIDINTLTQRMGMPMEMRFFILLFGYALFAAFIYGSYLFLDKKMDYQPFRHKDN